MTVVHPGVNVAGAYQSFLEALQQSAPPAQPAPVLTPEQTLYLDAICGCPCDPSMGPARDCGNQWNEDWQWDRRALSCWSLDHLKELYQKLKA